jgi:hypothetical protein
LLLSSHKLRNWFGPMPGRSLLRWRPSKWFACVACRAWIDTLLFNARMVAGTGDTLRLAKRVDIA